MKRRLLLIALCIVLDLLTSTSRAFAGCEPQQLSFFSADLDVTRTRQWGSMPLDGDGAPRNLVGLAIPRGAMNLVGIGAALEVRGCMFGLTALGLHWATSTSDAVASGLSADATSASATFGRTDVFEIVGPSFGFQIYDPTESLFKVELGLQWGGQLARTGVRTTDAAGISTDSDIHQATYFLRANGAVCWLARGHTAQDPDPPLATNLCLTVAPMLATPEGALTGITFGIRGEL